MEHDPKANDMAVNEMVDTVSRMLAANPNLCPSCVIMHLSQNLLVSLVLNASLPPKKSRKMFKDLSRQVEGLVKKARRGEVTVTMSDDASVMGH